MDTVGSLQLELTNNAKQRTDKVNANQNSTSLQLDEVHRRLNDVINLTVILNNAQDALVTKTRRMNVDEWAGENTSIQAKWRSVHDKITKCYTRMISEPHGSIGAFCAEKEWKARIHLLDARIPTYSAMKLGVFSFQSREDVDVFVEQKMLLNADYLFFSFMMLSHCQNHFREFSMSKKMFSMNFINCKRLELRQKKRGISLPTKLLYLTSWGISRMEYQIQHTSCLLSNLSQIGHLLIKTQALWITSYVEFRTYTYSSLKTFWQNCMGKTMPRHAKSPWTCMQALMGLLETHVLFWLDLHKTWIHHNVVKTKYGN